MENSGRGWIRSPVVGGILGVFTGGLVVLVVETIGHQLLGTAGPGDLSKVTMPMFAAVLVAWILGCAAGGWMATYWSQTTSSVTGTVVGLVLLAGSVANFFAFPHPIWLMISAVILMPLAAFMGASKARRVSD